MIDWNLLQYLYEVYGASKEDLAAENGTTVRMVNYVAEERGWKRSKLAETARDWKDHEVLDEDILTEVKSKMNAMSLLNQHGLNPKLQSLEVHLINKAIDVTQSIDPDSPIAADAVQKMSVLLEKLKSTNPAIQACLNSNKNSANGESNTIKIQVITGFTEKSHDVIEVSAPTLPKLAEVPEAQTA